MKQTHDVLIVAILNSPVLWIRGKTLLAKFAGNNDSEWSAKVGKVGRINQDTIEITCHGDDWSYIQDNLAE